jgi:cell division transport system ATP-binding protein
MPFVTFAGVTKTYGRRGKENPALIDLSFELERGEFVLLTGHSGAGKSTLLRLFSAAERPDRGIIEIGGHRVDRLSPALIPYYRRHLGVVFQDFRLVPWASALDNVRLALEVRGDTPWSIRARAASVLRDLGIDPKIARPVAQLSGGEQQRVALARALATSPTLLLADEATGNLDFDRACEVLDTFEAIRQAGTTVIFASHGALVRQRVKVDRLLRLGDGRLLDNICLKSQNDETAGRKPLASELEFSTGFLGWASCEPVVAAPIEFPELLMELPANEGRYPETREVGS